VFAFARALLTGMIGSIFPVCPHFRLQIAAIYHFPIYSSSHPCLYGKYYPSLPANVPFFPLTILVPFELITPDWPPAVLYPNAIFSYNIIKAFSWFCLNSTIALPQVFLHKIPCAHSIFLKVNQLIKPG
jgi:hypothetical protein